MFACCSDDQSDGAKKLKTSSAADDKTQNKIHVIQMDITKHEQVENALNYVEDNLQKNEELWGLVNNAGVYSLGFVEWLNLEDFKQVYNFKFIM